MAEPKEAAELPTRDACQVPSAATPPHYVRRHTGILPGPTRGYHPNVWGYLFELLVQEESIAVTEDHQLLLHDADRLGDRMVLRTETILEGFAWLARHRLVGIRVTADAHFASPDLGALRDLLREKQELERAGALASDILKHFRTRSFCARLPWLDQVLGNDGEANDA